MQPPSLHLWYPRGPLPNSSPLLSLGHAPLLWEAQFSHLQNSGHTVPPLPIQCDNICKERAVFQVDSECPASGRRRYCYFQALGLCPLDADFVAGSERL